MTTTLMMMMKNKQVGFSKKQNDILLEVFKGEYDMIFADGAIRSGKTMILLIAFVLWAMSTYNETDLIIAGKTVGAANRNLIRPLRRIQYMRNNFNIKYTANKGYMEINRGDVTNYFYIFGGNNEKSQDVVQGGTMGGAFLDEVTLMPRSFVDQVMARCSLEDALILFSSNPEDPNHWYKKDFIDNAKGLNAYYKHFVMDDNPSLSERVKNRYKRQYTGVFYDRYVLGKWTKAEGIIYRTFVDNKEKFIFDEIPEDWKLDFVRLGVDFGGTESATAFVAYGCFNGFRELVILDDYRLDGDYNTHDLGKAYQEFEAKIYNEFKLWMTTRADSAEQVLIRSLRDYAQHSSIKNAKKGAIFGRIKFTNSMIDLNHFWVRRRANNVIDALDNAIWSDKQPDTRLDDKTTARWIDFLDAMEYSYEEDMKRFMRIVSLLKYEVV